MMAEDIGARRLETEDGNNLFHILCSEPFKAIESFQRLAKRNTTIVQLKEELKRLLGNIGSKAEPKKIARELSENYIAGINKSNATGLSPLDLLGQFINRVQQKGKLVACNELMKEMICLGAELKDGFLKDVAQMTCDEILCTPFVDMKRMENIPRHMPIQAFFIIRANDVLDGEKRDGFVAAKMKLIAIYMKRFQDTYWKANIVKYTRQVSALRSFLYLLKHLIPEGPLYTENAKITLAILQCIKATKSQSLMRENEDIHNVLMSLFHQLLGSRRNIDINFADHETGQTSLHLAVELGMREVTQFLLTQKDIDINKPDACRITPLMSLIAAIGKLKVLEAASVRCYWDIGEILLRSTSIIIDARNANDCTPLIAFIYILQKSDYYKQRKILGSVLTPSRPDICLPTGKYLSPLNICAMHDLDDLAKTILDENPDEINRKDNHDRNSLHVAALHNSPKCIKLLIHVDSSLCNAKDEKGNTPLFYVVIKCQPETAIEVIKNFDWDFSIINHCNETVYMFYKIYFKQRKIRGNDDIVLSEALKHTLRTKDPRTFKKEKEIRTMDRSLWFPRQGTALKSTRKKHDTGFSRLTHRLDVEVEGILRNTDKAYTLFKILSDKSHDHLIRYKDRTALMHCARFGLLDELEYLLSLALSADAVNAVDRQNKSALHMAAEKGHTECVRALLDDSRIDKNIKDSANQTVIYAICKSIHMEDALKFLTNEKYRWDFEERNSFNYTIYDYYMKHCDDVTSDLANFLSIKCPRTMHVSIIKPKQQLLGSDTDSVTTDTSEMSTPSVNHSRQNTNSSIIYQQVKGASASVEKNSIADLNSNGIGQIPSSSESGGNYLNCPMHNNLDATFSKYRSGSNIPASVYETTAGGRQSLSEPIPEWEFFQEKLRIYFCDHFISNPKFFDRLISYKVFKPGDASLKKLQDKELQDEEVARKLADTLPRKGIDGFVCFIKALHNDGTNHSIAEQFEKKIRQSNISKSSPVQPSYAESKRQTPTLGHTTPGILTRGVTWQETSHYRSRPLSSKLTLPQSQTEQKQYFDSSFYV